MLKHKFIKKKQIIDYSQIFRFVFIFINNIYIYIYILIINMSFLYLIVEYTCNITFLKTFHLEPLDHGSIGLQ